MTRSRPFRRYLFASWALALLALGWICLSPKTWYEAWDGRELVSPLWWQRVWLVGLILVGVSTATFRLSWRLSRGGRVASLVAVALAMVLCKWGHGSVATRGPMEESCRNCRSFIGHAFREYAEAHEGWLPRGGRDECDSLGKCVSERAYGVHHFTSHALSGAAYDYWKRTGSLSDAVTPYRYNEGLRVDDPEDLILMYFEHPTRWRCRALEGRILGRPCMTWREWYWTFLPEAEFQRAQTKTEAFLRRRAEQERDQP